ncbi:MAG: DNA cytosine methyltransferase [Omnitrophica bacterium]|nr:DNA cytosine methyltransferase [Candidatus Omnitrophota bacterium]
MEKHSVVSLFSGCGGLDFGFYQAGFNLVWANEISEDAAQSYSSLLGHNVVTDDIWRVIEQVPHSDVVIGGPPCQSFSLVGKRLETDPRGKLVFAYEQVIKNAKPLAFVMENVPGLMSSHIDGTRLHLYLADQFMKLGYKVSILKLIATDFFVPQKRRRVFMIGHRIDGKSFDLIDADAFAKILGEPNLKSPVTVSDALDDLPNPLRKGNKASVAYKSSPHSAYSQLMRQNGPQEIELQTMPTMSELDREFVKHIPPGGNYNNIPDSISTKRILSFKKSGGRTTTYGRLHQDAPAYTINTYFNRPNVGANYHHEEERLITVREALRLQSFPDYFTPYYSNQRSLHMQIGNAVPPLMARAVAESLKRLLA